MHSQGEEKTQNQQVESELEEAEENVETTCFRKRVSFSEQLSWIKSSSNSEESVSIRSETDGRDGQNGRDGRNCRDTDSYDSLDSEENSQTSDVDKEEKKKEQSGSSSRQESQRREGSSQRREGSSQRREGSSQRRSPIEILWDTEFRRKVCYEELPAWLKDNEFLREGYRHPIRSVKSCFKTIFRVHTETGNIWTHLIGALMHVIYMIMFTANYFGRIPMLDYFVVVFFFAGAISCFMLSTLYHSLNCHSEEVMMAFARLDYIGINLLITASQTPWIYFAFYCHKRTRNTYMAILLLGSVTLALLSLFERFSDSSNKSVRSILFSLFSSFCVVPILHKVQLEGFEQTYYENSLGYIIVMLSAYGLGAVVYSLKFPERLRPGTFDIFFNSHQLMHVCTIIASYIYMHAVYDMVGYRMTIGPCPSHHNNHHH